MRLSLIIILEYRTVYEIKCSRVHIQKVVVDLEMELIT